MHGGEMTNGGWRAACSGVRCIKRLVTAGWTRCGMAAVAHASNQLGTALQNHGCRAQHALPRHISHLASAASGRPTHRELHAEPLVRLHLRVRANAVKHT